MQAGPGVDRGAGRKAKAGRAGSREAEKAAACEAAVGERSVDMSPSCSCLKRGRRSGGASAIK